VLTWDKDDEDAMRFVAACANLRAYAFHIPLKSLFEIKCLWFPPVLKKKRFQQWPETSFQQSPQRTLLWLE